MQVDIPAAPYYIEAQPLLTALSRVAPALRHDSAPFEYPIKDIPDSIRDRAHLICAAFVNTHDECRDGLQRQSVKIRDRLREQLWSAACLRDYQLACVQRAYESEVQQIEREFEAEKAQLKEKLLADLLEHRRRLTEGQKETGQDTPQFPGVSTGLGDAEIYEDLVNILRDDASVSSRKTRQAAHLKSSDGEEPHPPPEEEIFVKGETLHCHGNAFVCGNSVIVGTPDSSELSGVISAVSTKDLWIRIDDGAKLKITYQQLRAGRYKLSHEEDGSSADSS